jgi:VanZ family protein
MSDTRQPLLNRRYAIVTAMIMAVILYGSFYPFDFRVPEGGIGPVRVLLGTWGEKPERGDFLANILLYMPLGFFGVLAFASRVAAWRRVAALALLGALLSLTVELTQYYDEGRDTTLNDLYSNTLGTLLGAIGGILVAGRVRWALLRDLVDNREPALLLAGWLGYRLFPYVPTIDLHKYWDALKPVVLHPSLTPYDLIHHTAIWLVVYALFAAIFRRRYPVLLMPFFVGAVLFAKILILDASLSVAEIAGAALAFALWILLGASERLRVMVITLLFAATVAAARLEPFQFGAAAGHFQWIPFYGFMQGSIDIDVQSFFEKFFLYGSLIWLLVRSGMRLGLAAALVALLLFATSWIELYLPGRSAEVTDAVMALAIAAIAALTKPPQPRIAGGP